MNEKCLVCGRDKSEYQSTWICAKNHDWRGSWRKDKTSEKYKKYLLRRHESMKNVARKKLEELNKKTPEQYKIRSRKTITKI